MWCGSASRPTSSRSPASTSRSSGSGSAGRASARSTRRRRRRSRSTPTRACSSASAASESGDAITFVREVEHLDFVEAVERLASGPGSRFATTTSALGQDRSRKAAPHRSGASRDRVLPRRCCSNRPTVARPAGSYLRSRGFDGDAARRFQLGWSPDGWDPLSRTSSSRSSPATTSSTPASVREQHQPAPGPVPGPAHVPDLRRPRRAGRLRRARPGRRAARSTRTRPRRPIYQKSRLLYGLNWAKGEIVARGEVVICEGYTDVMALHARRRAERGRDVRHRAGRRPLPDR